jgi:hypothetical protein
LKTDMTERLDGTMTSDPGWMRLRMQRYVGLVRLVQTGTSASRLSYERPGRAIAQ